MYKSNPMALKKV